MMGCTFDQAQTAVPSLTRELWDDVVNEDRSHQVGQWLEAYGIVTSDEQLRTLLEALALMLGQNRVLNLTAIRDVDKALVLHLVDSALFAPPVGEYAGPVLDLGTGGGFPGLPLAILCPEHEFLLVDSVKKKVAAVQKFADVLGLAARVSTSSDRAEVLGSTMRGRFGVVTLVDSVKKKVAAVQKFADVLGLAARVSTSSDRAEVLGSTMRGRFGVVTARAVAPTNVLLEYASPLVKSFGALVAGKAELSHEEEDQASSAARQVGMELVSRETLDLPDGFGHREILVYEKAGKPRVSLPRAVGMAKSNPLH